MRAYELMPGAGVVLNPDCPQPSPGPTEVLIRVQATSLNYRDLRIARGGYSDASSTGLIPLSDGSGEIEAVGSEVRDFQVGDRVAGTFFPHWPGGEVSDETLSGALGGERDGMLAEYVVLPASGVIHVPAHLSDEEAATLPCAGVTAWHAVRELGRVGPGQSVLLLGTGGVSLFALQFARLSGARTIITSSSDEKLQRAQALGADDLINYRSTPQWSTWVLDLTGGRGVDLVVEVGGAGTLPQSIQATRVGGNIAVIGGVAGPGEVNPGAILRRSVRMTGVYVGSREMFARMNRALELAQLHPVVDRVFDFQDAPQAYAYQQSGQHFGKVVVRVN